MAWRITRHFYFRSGRSTPVNTSNRCMDARAVHLIVHVNHARRTDQHAPMNRLPDEVPVAVMGRDHFETGTLLDGVFERGVASPSNAKRAPHFGLVHAVHLNSVVRPR
jgi:hypothetical protein